MMHKQVALKIGAALTLAALLIGFGRAQSSSATISPDGSRISTIASTVPPNGDINPYGVVVVPASTGSLVAGDVLVSNFNDSQNLQGTGTTIVEVSPRGGVHVFAHIDAHRLPGKCPGGVGLTTALTVTSSGWVIVGSLPTTDGMADTARAGCLIVLDHNGRVAETFSGDPINGPWDMTSVERGSHVALFVTNVLNGTVAGNGNVVHRGTVVRFDLMATPSVMPKVVSTTIIGSGFSERTDPAALVIGPTGVGLRPDGGVLFVADSLNNRIAAIPDPLTRMRSAGTGVTFTMNGALNDPLGLTATEDGGVLCVNGDDGFLVRTDARGMQLHKTLLDHTGSPPGAGALFGIALAGDDGLYFVDDATNTLNIFR